MTRSTFLLLAGAFSALLSNAKSHLRAAEDSRPAKPNLIFVLVDDVARDWYSCYGSSQPTPNVDKLAAEGVRFETAWCTPLCTPTRMTFLSGMYPFRSGWTIHCDVPRSGGKGFDPDKFTCIARVLKQAGYATAIAGKWQVKDIMQKHGFDEHCLWTGVERANKPSSKRYWDPFLQINGERATHTGQFGPEITQKFALDFIANHKQGPFFLYCPMIAAHQKLEALPGSDGKPAAENKAGKELMAGYITYIDRQVGELMARLDALGIAENTVVVFAGDNGTAGGGTLNGHAIPSGKAKVSDLGVHVPLIIRAPMLAKKGFVTAALADFTDLYPTFAELAGGTLPHGVMLDVRSLVPVLKGEARESKPWIFSQLGTNRIVRDTRWLFHNTGQFYDLQSDPLEKADLAASTEPEAAAARERLTKIMASLPADGPPPFAEFPKPR